MLNMSSDGVYEPKKGFPTYSVSKVESVLLPCLFQAD